FFPPSFACKKWPSIAKAFRIDQTFCDFRNEPAHVGLGNRNCDHGWRGWACSEAGRHPPSRRYGAPRRPPLRWWLDSTKEILWSSLVDAFATGNEIYQNLHRRCRNSCALLHSTRNASAETIRNRFSGSAVSVGEIRGRRQTLLENCRRKSQGPFGHSPVGAHCIAFQSA